MKTILRRSAVLAALLFLLAALGPGALAVPPTITVDLPGTAAVTAGGQFTLTVEASGDAPAYQWYKNDVAIEGQTGPSYTETGVAADSNGARYFCFVTNSEGSCNSSTCVLTVIQQPVLTQDIGTTALTVNEGDNITLTAYASGDNLLIQWFRVTASGDYSVIPGQSGSTLSVTAAAEYADTDVYCQFTNEAGSVTSSRCHITLNGPTPSPSPTSGPPAITKDPTGESVQEGGSAIFIARADGATGITWRFISPDGGQSFDFNLVGSQFPGLAVSGGNSETLSLSNIPYELNGWKVACYFNGQGGGTLSQGAAITVQKVSSTLSIITQPMGGTMTTEEKPDFTLSIQASASNGGTLSYQWYSAASNSAAAMTAIPGATGSSYRPERVEGTRYYRVSVTVTSPSGAASEPVYSSIVSVTFTAPAHEHSYSTIWEYNDISHWHQCTCGDHADEAFHTYEWTTVKAASKDADGEQRGVCTVCGYETVQPIPAGTQTEDTETPEEPEPVKRRGGGSIWLILLGILAAGVVGGAAYLIRRILLEGDDEEDYEDEEETEETPDTGETPNTPELGSGEETKPNE